MNENHITAQRIADVLTAKNVDFEQKRMFGGECFMVEGKMLMGTYKGGMMARTGSAEAEELSNRKGASQMMHAGRLMAGYLFVEPEGYENDGDLMLWVEKCLVFNPLAKASGKKK